MKFNIYKAKRHFDSDVQQNRKPIKDMEKFKKGQEDFYNFYLKAMENAQNGIHDKFNLESSLNAADKLIEMEAQRAIPWTLRCLALFGLGRFAEALEANSQSIEIDPSDPDKWRSRSRILKMLGQNEEAIEAEKMATKMTEDK